MLLRSAWSRAVTAGVVVMLAVSTAAVPGAAASPARPATSPAGTALPAGTASPRYGATTPLGEVTLVTGDVVAVGIEPGGALAAEVTTPALRVDGRPVLFSTVRDGAALYVYPSDALGLVDAGRLDPRLFDVAYLVRNGYADRTTPTLPVIVEYPATVRAADDLGRRADALPASASVAALPVVNGAAVRVDKPQAAQFWGSVGRTAAGVLGSGVSKVWLDGTVRADLDRSVPMIGAPQAWAAGYDGAGVKVAVLDTGIDAAHPDFAGKDIATQSFVTGQTVQDGNGHGTHVASTIVASGGRARGVASRASLLVGKVLDNAGQGLESQIIAGMQWAAQQGADVVNMSLGGCCTNGTDPMSLAVNRLTAQTGTLFVVAAGNSGAAGDRTVYTPGAADAALTVAAVDLQDKLAPFSSRGPRTGDFALKPDIAAPGVAITAARAEGTALGPVVDDKYTTISGTSMATPHVAGAAAILAQQHPDWTGPQLKAALMSTAKDTGHGAYAQGAGRVDVAHAVTSGVFASGSVDFGVLPYESTTPAVRTVTYTNGTDTPVTLALDATIKARGGTAPAGSLRLDRTSVTVPAQGSATVEVTFDPANGPQAMYEGAVRAHADGVDLVTAVAGIRFLKRVTMTARIIPPDGATDLFWGGWVFMRIDGRTEVPTVTYGPDVAEHSVQLYSGRYAVRSFVEWRDRNGSPNAALVVLPDVDATGDATVVFDLRKAKRVGTNLPRPADRYAHQFGFESTAAGGKASVRSEIRMYGAMSLWALPTGAKPTLGSFYAYSQQVYVEPRVSMRVQGRASTLDVRYPVPNVLVADDEITRFDGRRTLPVVYAGDGKNFAGLDVRGKLVLLDLADICATTCTDYAADRVRAAADAGAAGVLGFGSVGRGFLDPDPYASRSIWPVYPIPTASLAADQGRALRDSVARGQVKVDVTGSVNPDYVYALTYPWMDNIPASVSASLRPDDVYQIDNRIHADAPGAVSLSWNAQLPFLPGRRVGDRIRRVGSGNDLPVRAPDTVTSYVGPLRPDLGWNLSASLSYDVPASTPGYFANGWSEGRIEEFTRPGRRTQDLGEQPLVSNTTRYGPAVARYFDPTCLSCRNGDMLNPVHLLDNDGTGGGYQAYDITGGAYGTPQTEFHLYRNGTEIPVQTGLAWIAPPWFAYQNPYFTLPPERADYRLTERFQVGWLMQRYARTVDTTWTFASERPTTGYTAPEQGANCMGWYITLGHEMCQATSQLFVGYNLGLGLDNTLPAGGLHLATVSAYHSQFLPRPPKITKLALWISGDDGARWIQMPTWPLGNGRYAVTLAHPTLAATTGAISLRVRAVDSDGNTVEQTVHRAYGLR